MPCPFAVAGYNCNYRPRCVNRCSRCINTDHVPFHSANARKHDCVSNIISEHERESRWKQSNGRKSIGLCTEDIEEGGEKGVECFRNSISSKPKTYCRLYSTLKKNAADFCANCNMTEAPSNYPSPSVCRPQPCRSFSGQAKPKCLNFKSACRDFSSQTKAATVQKCPKPNCRECSYESKASKCNNSRYSRPSANGSETTSADSQGNDKCDVCNKDLLRDIQNKINDISSQCDGNLKQNEDFVQHLWRLCNAKTLQLEWANLAKNSPISEHCTQTENDSSAGTFPCAGRRTNDVDGPVTMQDEVYNPSVPNRHENGSKSTSSGRNVPKYESNSPCNPRRFASEESPETVLSQFDRSERAEVPFIAQQTVGTNCCPPAYFSEMCRPLILCTAQMDVGAGVQKNDKPAAKANKKEKKTRKRSASKKSKKSKGKSSRGKSSKGKTSKGKTSRAKSSGSSKMKKMKGADKKSTAKANKAKSQAPSVGAKKQRN